MAELTKEQLKSKLAEAEAKLKEETARRKSAEEVSKAAVSESVQNVVSLEEFKKLQQAHQNLSQEHDELVMKYESSPDLEKKVAEAVKRLSDKPKALLFKKMSLALGEVRRIPKNGWNDFFKYKYSQEGDILDGIRPILADVGLMVWTTIAEEQRKAVTTFYKGKENGQKTITWVKIEFTVGCADTGETIVSHYSGEGEDEGDKGLYKAYTGATKYFLTKNFLISSGDILQDNEPTDPEADTARHKERSQQNAQNGSNSRQNQSRNQREGQRQEYQNQPPQNDPKIEKEKAEMLSIWTKLAGNEEGFEGFYNKQTKKGVSHGAILDYLNKTLADKQAEARKNQQEGGETPQDAPPTNQPPQEQKQQEGPTGASSVDDMTPEQYLAYVEENLPFPLTDSERQQILNDAREGNRNHRK